MNREGESAGVPETDKQVEEDLWETCGAERGVWTETMLIALKKGVKGNKWFSLIDKVRSERTLGIAWEKVQSNAGACGVDGISVGFFAKDSQNRLLAVNEHLKKDSYEPKPTGHDTEARKQREETVGNTDGARSRGTKRGEVGDRTNLRARIC